MLIQILVFGLLQITGHDFCCLVVRGQAQATLLQHLGRVAATRGTPGTWPLEGEDAWPVGEYSSFMFSPLMEKPRVLIALIYFLIAWLKETKKSSHFALLSDFRDWKLSSDKSYFLVGKLL